jgi:hypothetical protein
LLAPAVTIFKPVLKVQLNSKTFSAIDAFKTAITTDVPDVSS